MHSFYFQWLSGKVATTFLISAFALMFFSTTALSQTTLVAGDIAIIGFNYDNADVVRFVNLVDIAAGTEVRFTDNGWNGTTLATSEGTDVWTAPVAYAKGTVHSLTPASMALGTSGDQLFVYQGTAASPVFIFGLTTKAWVTGSISTSTSRRPAALTTGSTAIAFSVERDNGRYNPLATTGDKNQVLTAVANTTNWTTTDTRISTFPAWTFTLNGLAAAPTAQPTNLSFTNVKSYKFNNSFTAAAGNPTGYLVLRSTGSAANTVPADAVAYSTGDVLGNARVMSTNTTTSFLNEGTTANTAYYYTVYAYNGSGANTNYLQTNPLSGFVTTNVTEMGSYYQGVSETDPSFIATLQNRIRSPFVKVAYDQYDETMMTHFAFGYGSGSQLSATCVYSGQVQSYNPPFAWIPNTVFSREHTWATSWTPSNATSSFNEYCDQHHLFPVNQNDANAVRSNHPLGEVTVPIDVYLEGIYGYDATGNLVYEPRDSHKGDAARALLYMSLRYNGINGFDWTFNNLNNNILPALNVDPQSVATLLQWHAQDAPDNYEIARNDYIQSIQQNRNPLIDHPEWTANIDFNNLTWIASPQMTMQEDEDESNEALVEEKSMHVWPNPANDLVYAALKGIENQNITVVVYDMMGALQMSETRMVEDSFYLLELDVQALSSGTYLVAIITDHDRFAQPLVVQ